MSEPTVAAQAEQNGNVTYPQFRADLYQGTAEAYDGYRPLYPADLIVSLARRTGADGTGRLLDLACGTGHVAFALADRFAEIWLADQEPDMIAVVKRKAAGDPGRFRYLTGAAERLDLPPATFDLVTIGNAFHRLPRDVVTANVRRWLRPGGHLALLWGGSPNLGGEPWQQTLQAVMYRWHDRNAADRRIPAGYDEDRRARPDLEILAAAGFEIVASFEATVGRSWTIDEILGYVASTSILSPSALGADAEEFETDLRSALRSCDPDEPYWQDATFKCELARVPQPGSTG
jgi:SAM-dependent methyltransferase